MHLDIMCNSLALPIYVSTHVGDWLVMDWVYQSSVDLDRIWYLGRLYYPRYDGFWCDFGYELVVSLMCYLGLLFCFLSYS